MPASLIPSFILDPNSERPMYRQLYDWFQRAIVDGELRPGQRVPSSRSLTAELQFRESRFSTHMNSCAQKATWRRSLERVRVWRARFLTTNYVLLMTNGDRLREGRSRLPAHGGNRIAQQY